MQFVAAANKGNCCHAYFDCQDSLEDKIILETNSSTAHSSILLFNLLSTTSKYVRLEAEEKSKLTQFELQSMSRFCPQEETIQNDGRCLLLFIDLSDCQKEWLNLKALIKIPSGFKNLHRV
jgi:hypothetical protein